MAVTGFLQLLTNFKMNSLGALSQSNNQGCSSSSTSVLTQVIDYKKRNIDRSEDRIFYINNFFVLLIV